MKTDSIRSILITLIAAHLILAGCTTPDPPPPKPFKTLDMIELPLVTVEAEVPFDSEYSFILEISRVGNTLWGGYSSTITHDASVLVQGSKGTVWGEGSGFVEMTFLEGEMCPVVCEAELTIWMSPSELSQAPQCQFTLRMSYAESERECYSPCFPDIKTIAPDVTGTYMLSDDFEPLIANMEQLLAGFSRGESTGIVPWISDYQAHTFDGEDTMACGLFEDYIIYLRDHPEP